MSVCTQYLNETIPTAQSSTIKESRRKIYWRNVIFLIYTHVTSIYTLTQFPPHLYTILLNVVLYVWGFTSITVGCHRLWAHKSYKAVWPLRLFLVIGHGFTFQTSVYHWVWKHRIHHKFTDTDADPHNINRGLFFSQIGWLMQKPHEEVYYKKETIDLRDLQEDFMIKWQHKLYPFIGPFSAFFLPTVVSFYFWNEDLLTAWNFSILRFIISLNITSLVNSIAHTWGTHAYDSNISPSNNALVSMLTFGEGSHNYHHVFPWDYKTAESKSYFLNSSLLILDLCAKLGLAYDLKEASPEIIQKRVLRTGNVNTNSSQKTERLVWGLEDVDMDEHEKKMVKSLYRTEAKKRY